MSRRDISRLRPFGPKAEYVHAIIETPKGSRTKYKYENSELCGSLGRSAPQS